MITTPDPPGFALLGLPAPPDPSPVKSTPWGGLFGLPSFAAPFPPLPNCPFGPISDAAGLGTAGA